MTKDTVSIRLDPARRERLAAVAEAMGERLGGAELPVSIALRTALDRGLTVLEEEFTVKGKAKK